MSVADAAYPIPFHSNPALDFVAAPALAPPEVHLSEEDKQRLENDAQAAINAPLPDEDDADL